MVWNFYLSLLLEIFLKIFSVIIIKTNTNAQTKRLHLLRLYQKSLPECLETIDAKIVFRDSKVWMLKNCKTHGESEVMIADDVEYYKQIQKLQ